MAGTANDLESAAGDILDDVTEELLATSLQPHAVTAASRVPRCAAVDGGSTVILNARTVGMYKVRAGYVLREPNDRHLQRITAVSPRTVSKKNIADVWSTLKRQYGWGVDVEAPTLEAPRLVPQMAEAERVLSEFDAARRALHELKSGDLLLLDGSLDDDERYAPLRENLLRFAQDGGVGIVALSKDTSLSIGGVLPFTLELEELSVAGRAAAPWFVDVTEALNRPEGGYRILGAQFDPRAMPYRVDVAGIEPKVAVAALAALCNDPAYSGYPYPLAKVHARVHFEPGEALDLRRDLEGIVARRRGHRLSLRLFGQGRDVLELAN